MWFFSKTESEKKRDYYRKLYEGLDDYLTRFDKKLKTMEKNIETYESNRPFMSEAYIPEDIFNKSESSVKLKIRTVFNCQSMDAIKLSNAVDMAYERYKYYEQLVEQERLEEERKIKEMAKNIRGRKE